MNRKMIRNIAILIVIVFGITIIVYPLIFGTDEQSPDSAPVELELHK